MQIINLKQKLQKELNNFDQTEPYTFFFIDYGQPSQISCKLVPSENETVFISIINEQQKERIHETKGTIDVTYSAWSDECDAPAEIHAVSVFYKNERIVKMTDDLVETMTQMIQEIFDVVGQDD